MRFSQRFFVEKADIDEQSHVNNVAYVKWIQNVAVAHWLSVTNEEQQAKYTWLVLRHEIDYKKPAFEREEITATTWTGEPTRAIWERLTEITRGAELLVKARSVWCLVDRETLKPTRITSELKELFQMR